MMGMGEPMLNLDNVIPALRLMLDDNAYGLSRRRVTVSTAGVIPGMDRLRDECPVALAISLHAPNDELRDRLVPVNRKYPLRELIAACNRYLDKAPRDFVTFEYVMLDGVNDEPTRTRASWQRSRARVRCKYNLIPFNPFPQLRIPPLRSASASARFAEILARAGVTVTTRKTRGDDIAAACGQLAGDVADRTRRSARRIALKEAARVSAPAAPGRAGLLAACAAQHERTADPVETRQVDRRGRRPAQPRAAAHRARRLYYSRGNMSVALEELRIAVAADPNYAPAYGMFGLVYMELKREPRSPSRTSSARCAWRRTTPTSTTTTAGSCARPRASRSRSSTSCRRSATRSTRRRGARTRWPGCAACGSRT